MKTGIVIIHYNDLESLKHLVENVENYHVISKIVIVDNNSRKDVKKSLRLITGKKIKLIENKKNFGFAKAINIGRKYFTDAVIGVAPFQVIGVVIPVGYSTVTDEDQALAGVKVKYLVLVVE